MRKFTLQEANDILYYVIEITEDAIAQLEEIRAAMGRDVLESATETEEDFQNRMNRVLEDWAIQVQELGVLPKGFFTCDFISLNPAVYFCWTYGEDQITHMHKVTESFKDRVPIENPEMQGFHISAN